MIPIWTAEGERQLSDHQYLGLDKVSFETNPTDSNRNLLNTATEKLETFYEENVKGINIRAWARWHEHGEKSTKYFLNLEKRNHVKKTYSQTCYKLSYNNRAI